MGSSVGIMLIWLIFIIKAFLDQKKIFKWPIQEYVVHRKNNLAFVCIKENNTEVTIVYNLDSQILFILKINLSL